MDSLGAVFDSCPLLEGVVDIVGSGKYVVRHYIELEVADHIDSVHHLVGSLVAVQDR